MADNWLEQHPVYDPNAKAAPQVAAPPAAQEEDDWLSKHPVAETQPTNLHPGMSEGDKYAANAVTGLHHVQGAVLGLPHNIAALGDYITSKLPYTSPEVTPGFLTRHTMSPAEWNAIPMMDAAAYPALAQAGINPLDVKTPNYKPETTLGRIGQETLSSAPLAAVGGGGLIPLVGRELANVSGIAAAEGARKVLPDSPGAQMAAGLLASFLTPYVAGRPLGAAANLGGKLWGSENKVQQTATNRALRGEPATSPYDDAMADLVSHAVGRGVTSVGLGTLGAALGPTLLPGLGELAPFFGFGVGSGAGFGLGNIIPNRLSSFEQRVQDAMEKIPRPLPPQASVTTGIQPQGMEVPPQVRSYLDANNARTTTPPPAMPAVQTPTLWDYLRDRAAGYATPQTQVFPGQ